MTAPAELTSAQLGVLARAVRRAPSVHNSQPWRLSVRGARVDLLERTDVVLPRHDPGGRDRTLSCGAALTDLELAVRALGRDYTAEIHDEGATVTIGGARPAAPRELALYRAIERRRSHRRPFHPAPVPERVRKALRDSGSGDGVHVVVPGRLDRLAELLGFATRVFRDDRGYQRELELWTAHTHGWDALGDGVPEEAFGAEALPVAGLVRPGTPVPDDVVLAGRLAAENLLVVCTDDDSHAGRLAAGAALQRVWLTATVQALAGSVLTQPLHLTGVRARLAGRLALPGVPQAIFRYGYPAVPATPSPRRPLGELFPDGPTGGLR